MSRELVLLVEDDPTLLVSMGRYLQLHDYSVVEAPTCAIAEQQFRLRRPDLVLSDYELPDGDGVELMHRLRRIDRTVPFVMLTGHATIDLAVRAIKEGAEQFLTKPVDFPALLAVMGRLLDERRGRELNAALNEKEWRDQPDPFVGESRVIHELRDQAQRLADADGPVLLLGETGTGKGVLSRWMHAHGPRGSERFVDLNCAGLSRELLENELFGHERGAFTGAQNAKPGLLEVAHKGTLFLDEIGDVDLQVQPRLLKVLEEKRFRRLGDVKDRAVDVRLIAATHHDLLRSVREKKFREDLYFRLSVLPLRLPPLRERPEDVPHLARRLLKPGVSLSRGAEQALRNYPWPGNVRELRNVLERAQVLSGSSVLDVEDLQLGKPSAALPADQEGEPLTLEALEQRHIERVLKREKGKVARTALVLGISRSALYEKIRRYRLDAHDEEDPS